MTKRKKILILLLALCLCSCSRIQHKVINLEEDIQTVEMAVNQYVSEKSILPYTYREEEHSLTTKYLVNFENIAPYLSHIPTSAFTYGGNFIYVFTDIGTNNRAKIRVFDLRVKDRVEYVQDLVKRYKEKHRKLPIREQITKDMYLLDIRKLQEYVENVPSPYQYGRSLGYLLDRRGHVYLDYRLDAMQLVQKNNFTMSFEKDLRILLSASSLYVPAYSAKMKYSHDNILIEPM